MSNDIQKYENWRAITESDYVTMFIKTWFAFVATLRELYPNISVFTDDGKPRGDRPFTNEFQNKDLRNISENIDIVEFSNLLLKAYSAVREKTAIIFPQYFLSTFYRINEDFHYHKDSVEYTDEDKDGNKKVKDRNLVDLKIEDRFTLRVNIQVNGIYNRNIYNESIPLKIKLKDIIDSIDLSQKAFVDEFGYLQKFYKQLCDEIQQRTYSWMEQNLQSKYSSSLTPLVLSKIRFCLTEIVEQLNLNFKSIYQNKSEPENSFVILKQRPLPLFVHEMQKDTKEDEKYLYQKLKEDIFFWFIDFIISLRNALFHEIIDPLDEQWQTIYKNAYLLLKELLDSTTNYLIHKEVTAYVQETYIDVKNEKLNEEVKRVAESAVFDLEDYDLIDDDIEIEQIEVDFLDFSDDSSPSINKRWAKFRCKAYLLVDGRARVFDYDRSAYDKEDDKYYYFVNDEVSFRNAETEVEIEVEIEYDLRDISKSAEIINVSVIDKINRVRLSENPEDTDWEAIYPDED